MDATTAAIVISVIALIAIGIAIFIRANRPPKKAPSSFIPQLDKQSQEELERMVWGPPMRKDRADEWKGLS